MKAREWWVELKNGAAWEFSDKPAPHRECVHVREVLPDEVTITREELRAALSKANYGNDGATDWEITEWELFGYPSSASDAGKGE